MKHTIKRLTIAAAFGFVASAAFAQSSLPNVPGAVDPRVTQENIHQTVCLPGYSKSVRPPASVTEPRKRAALRASGYLDQNLSHYEWDHDFPIEVGGAPGKPHANDGDPSGTLNEWLEYKYPDDGWGVDIKDQFENYMHRELCADRITLKQAQDAFRHDWREAYNHYFLGAE